MGLDATLVLTGIVLLFGLFGAIFYWTRRRPAPPPWPTEPAEQIERLREEQAALSAQIDRMEERLGRVERTLDPD